jgi:hypothetical protein
MQTSAPWVVASWVLLHVVFYRTATAADPAFVDGVNEFRIRSQNLHVDYIEKQLDKLESEVNEWTDLSAADVTKVKARVQRLESWLIMPIIFLMFFLP